MLTYQKSYKACNSLQNIFLGNTIRSSLLNFYLVYFLFCLIFYTNLAAQITNGESENGSRLRGLGVHDPNSYSNPEDIRAENIIIKWNIDFDKTILNGSVIYNLVSSKPGVEKVIFDIRDLKIHDVKDLKGTRLPFEIGKDYLTMGKPLTVSLPQLVADSNGILRGDILIEYETSPTSPALQWLEKQMTAEKMFPFVYSLSHAIHARALFPCQDTPFTKATYSAVITAPKEAVVLFSAISSGDPKIVDDSKLEYYYIQKIPVPSYLVAFAAGQLESAVIGLRSKVWAEKSLLEDAVYDFAETEKMIQAVESIVGKYVWGLYDILVLPPSFPLGGMENPYLTFVSPTILTHDRSLSDIIAHEIAHSWTGNLVTNINHEHFWLNEGFTVFLERKILGILKGEKERQFAHIQGWSALVETVNTLGKESPMTKLIADLRGIDPDDSFSSIPYEKGNVFLYYLEQKVGGASIMNGFLRHYVETFQFKSLDSLDFKDNFIQYFKNEGKGDVITDVDWDDWFYSPGMPKEKPIYDTTLYDAIIFLSKRWQDWDEATLNPFSPNDLKNFTSAQIQEFLQTLISLEKPLNVEKVKKMEEIYGFNSYRNAEVLHRWLRVGIKVRWLEQVTRALEFVTKVGRTKYIRPIYRDLYDWKEVRPRAIDIFKNNRPSMMYISTYAVAKDLHLQDEKNQF